MKILILGMGNPILSDDGVGLLVAERLKGKVPGADVASCPVIGLSLFDQILGYDTIFIVDAMTARDGKIGTVQTVYECDSYGTLHLFSSHGMNIFELMELGRRCGFPVPRLAAVYGIQIGSEVSFGEALSPELNDRLMAITEEILADIVFRLSLPAHHEKYNMYRGASA